MGHLKSLLRFRQHAAERERWISSKEALALLKAEGLSVLGQSKAILQGLSKDVRIKVELMTLEQWLTVRQPIHEPELPVQLLPQAAIGWGDRTVTYHIMVSKEAERIRKSGYGYASRSAKPVVRPPPGSRLLAACEWLLPARIVERTVGQAVADMREEHAQALAEGRPRKARWIEIRDTARILVALAQLAWHRVGKFVLGFLKAVS